MLSIAICTHNPDPSLFERVLGAIAAQTERAFEVLVVDNASIPPLTEHVLDPLRSRGISARLVQEDRPGLVHARLRAIDATTSEWMLCVDDDNVLASDYVAQGFAFIRAHPEVAAFGGKLELPETMRPSRTLKPFLPYLAVRDVGDRPLMGLSDKWEIWEPPAAGAFVARAVLEDFAAFVRTHARAMTLGRGPASFASCEDSLLMHSAYRLGRPTAYNPNLRLQHHIDPRRLSPTYLLKLMEGYGRSHVVLDRLIRGRISAPAYYETWLRVAVLMAAAMAHHFMTSPLFAYARARYHLAAARAYRELPMGAQ